MPRFKGTLTSDNDPIIKSLFYVLSEGNYRLNTLSDLYDPLNIVKNHYFLSNSYCTSLTSVSLFTTHPLFGKAQQIFCEILCKDNYSSKKNVKGYCIYVYKNQKIQFYFSPGPELSPRTDANHRIPCNLNFISPSPGSVYLNQSSSILDNTVNQTFLALLYKSEHKGFTGKDMEIIIQTSTLSFLSRLNFAIKTLLPRWFSIHTLISLKFNCGWTKIKGKRYQIHSNYFKEVSQFIGSPCLPCPTQSECVPQGNINPFECNYLYNWETR